MNLVIRQDPVASGEQLMRTDRDLMETAAAGSSDLVVRFYEWDVPTISLGYHQPEDALDQSALARAAVPFVRRPTGGAAVLHSEELTYAVVVPAADIPGAATEVQRAVALAICEGLKSIGVDAQVEAKGEPLSDLANRASCFVRTSRWEVTAGGKKLVGSAQRKWESAILQHGSILLGDDHLRIAEFLTVSGEPQRVRLRQSLNSKSTCASAELGREVDPSEVRAAMESAFRDVFSQWCLSTLAEPGLR